MSKKKRKKKAVSRKKIKKVKKIKRTRPSKKTKKVKKVSIKKAKSEKTSELVPYVKDALEKDYSKADIKKALLVKGWDGKEIDRAFRQISFGKKENPEKVKSEKKSRKVERIPSGIGGFDKLIGGGFEMNSVNLVVGSSGSGKTIFAIQFLMDGIKKGESCLYITFEEKKEEFYKNMMQFGWDLERYEKESKFVFLEYSPEKIKSMLEEGGGTVESVIIKHKITRLVIDSVSSFALLFDDELAKREAALQLFDIIRNWNCTSLLTLQEEPTIRDEGQSTSLEFEADSIILLYFIRIGGKRRRLVEVLKMRGTKHSTEIYGFEISKAGVHVSGRVSVGNLLK